jgi:hypothetical protein
MPTARTLPADLPRRFARAGRATARTADASFEFVVADRFPLRLRGLAGLGAGELVPLLLPRCGSIHTFGMRAAIDVVWLDSERAEILAADTELPPRRLVRAPGARPARGRIAALELPAGEAEALGLGAGVALRLVPS